MKKSLVLFDIDYTLFDCDTFKQSKLREYKLYRETEKTLIEIAKIADVGILSEGEYDLQSNKLIQTDIKRHFNDDRVHIVVDKLQELPDVLKRYKDETLYLVDDKISILQAAKQVRNDLITVWIKRGPYATAVQSIMYTPDHEVKSLEEVLAIIK